MLAGRRCLITTVQSDSHTWNLIYIQLLLEELGATVINLGCCVPIEETISAIELNNPDLVIVSSVNGHGYFQGKELIERAQRELEGCLPPFIIGGKLSTNTEKNELIDRDLLGVGYDAVFQSDDAIVQFRKYLSVYSNSPSMAL